MRSKLLLLFLCVSDLGLFGQSTKDNELTLLDALNWTQQHEDLKHIADPDYAPFEFRDESGVTKGIGTDFLRAVCRKLGINIETTQAPTWNLALEGLKKGQYDIATVAAKTPERESYLNFTKPWISVPDVFMVREGGNIGTIDDLNQRQVGIIKSWAANGWLKEHYSQIHFVEIDSIADGLTRLALGKLDGVVLNLASASYELNRLKIPGLKVLGETGYVYELRFAVPKSDQALVSIMDRGLDLIDQTERDQIINKWISVKVETSALVSKILILAGLVTISIVVIFVILYIRSLRKISKLTNEKYLSSKELNDQYAQFTKKAFLARDKFLSIISHELRTPLMNISGISSILTQKVADQEIISQLKIVETSVKTITETLDDLLHYTNIESGITSLSYSSFTIDKLLDRLKQGLSAQAEANETLLSFTPQSDLPSEFFLDFDILYKIVFDIISICISRSPKGRVAVQIFVRAHNSSNFLRFEVTDSGPQFNVSDHENLFTPFGAVAESHDQESSAQVKLALSRNLAVSMGGWVDIESRSHSNCFWAEVVYAERNKAEFIETQKTVKQLYAELSERHLKILVADDNRTNLMVFSSLCKQLGIEEVSAVYDGTEAVLTFDETDPDYYSCIFLDIEMTIMGGYEAARTLRSHGYEGPIIAFTAYSFRDHEAQALESGMNALLVKPIYLDNLSECLKQWLS